MAVMTFYGFSCEKCGEQLIPRKNALNFIQKDEDFKLCASCLQLASMKAQRIKTKIS
jgi:hypothetical protein